MTEQRAAYRASRTVVVDEDLLSELERRQIARKALVEAARRLLAVMDKSAWHGEIEQARLALCEALVNFER